MAHHTKDKGDSGVGFVIADLISKGISICVPISEHLPFDLIGVRQNGITIRISVKYRTAKNGKITVAFKSIYSDSKGNHSKKIDKSMIDLIAIYCPDTNLVYYVNPKDFGECVDLRITPAKNGQTNGINNAGDYLAP